MGKIIKIICTITFFVLIFSGALMAEDLNWQELKGEHFIIYFNPSAGSTNNSNLDIKFAKEILDKSELYYQGIASDLGYPRNSEFWTWEKRVKIYLYPDHDAFLKASSQPLWSEGMADYLKKSILSYAGSREFKDTILPHEVAHLIFRDFVGFKGEIPLWLDEGVAQREERKDEKVKALAKQLYDRDSLLSLTDMTKLDIRNIVNKKNVYMRPSKTRNGERVVLFLTGDNLVNTYYVQAASLVSFLIEKFGSADFAHFCRQLRDGKLFDEAMFSVYGMYIRNFEDFEDQWRNYIDKG